MRVCYCCSFCACSLSLIGFIAPIPGVVSAIVREDLQYIVSDFPPILCVPRSRLFWFCSTMLPMDILIGVGISLLILILWLLHKVNLDLSSELSMYDSMFAHFL